jgi:hypothetical protein
MKHSLVVGCLLSVFLGACSGPETTEKKTAKPVEPVTGQTALVKMYQLARTWAPDVQILKMNTVPISEVKPTPGKSGAWQAFFASADKGRVRSYTYSVVEAEGNIHEGAFPGAEEPWSGPRESTFVIAGVTVDTDAAYKTAEGKAAAYKQQTKDKRI